MNESTPKRKDIVYLTKHEAKQRNEKPIEHITLNFADCDCSFHAYCEEHDSGYIDCPKDCEDAKNFADYHSCDEWKEIALSNFADDFEYLLESSMHYEKAAYYECLVLPKEYYDDCSYPKIVNFSIDAFTDRRSNSESKKRTYHSFWHFLRKVLENADLLGKNEDYSVDRLTLNCYSDFCELLIQFQYSYSTHTIYFLPHRNHIDTSNNSPLYVVKQEIPLRSLGSSLGTTMRHIRTSLKVEEEVNLFNFDIRESDVLKYNLVVDSYGSKICNSQFFDCDLFEDVAQTDSRLSYSQSLDGNRQSKLMRDSLEIFLVWLAHRFCKNQNNDDLDSMLENDKCYIDTEQYVFLDVLYSSYINHKSELFYYESDIDVPYLLALLVWVSSRKESNDFNTTQITQDVLDWLSKYPNPILDVYSLAIFEVLEVEYAPFIVACNDFALLFSVVVCESNSTTFDLNDIITIV